MYATRFLCCLMALVAFAAATPTPSDGRIVGGEVTSIQEFPYQVSVQLHGQHICGGAIIGGDTVLTAAHCFEDPWSSADYTVRVGSSEHASGGHVLSLQRVIAHGDYNAQSHDNDLALLILNARLNFTEHLQPVPLAALAHPPTADTRLLVSGWGFQAEESAVSGEVGVSPELRFVAVDLVASNQCRRAYSQVLPITRRMICAARPGRDSCQGDSGGPLVGYSAKEGPARLYGIVSWGLGCANPDFPGVYTNVAAFRSWIDEQVAARGWNELLAGWSGLQ
ncbi:trypsin alpha [Drosophila teissieri]|uniref:trypsin alpha n=1 Tax=Drosophila teissieri TaxID=7243 RepID=UPI001CB9E652|nr:trypsin alpha [Drosophila teissieri]